MLWTESFCAQLSRTSALWCMTHLNAIEPDDGYDAQTVGFMNSELIQQQRKKTRVHVRQL